MSSIILKKLRIKRIVIVNVLILLTVLLLYFISYKNFFINYFFLGLSTCIFIFSIISITLKKDILFEYFFPSMKELLKYEKNILTSYWNIMNCFRCIVLILLSIFMFILSIISFDDIFKFDKYFFLFVVLLLFLVNFCLILTDYKIDKFNLVKINKFVGNILFSILIPSIIFSILLFHILIAMIL